MALAVPALSAVGAVASSRAAPPAGGGARAAVASRVFDPVGANGVAQSALLRLSQRVTASVPARVLAGVSVNTHAGIVNVYLARGAGGRTAVAAAVPARQAGLVRVHRVPLSGAALSAAMARAGSVAGRLAAGRVPVQSWWRDFTRGVIVVSLYRPTAAQKAAAVRALAGIPARVTATRVKIAPIPAVTAPAATGRAAALVGHNRAFDTSPFAGGDFIDSTFGGFFHFCTDSWPIKFGGKQYITTAGHCAPAGHKWIVLTLNKNKQPLGNRKVVGIGAKNRLKTRHHLDVQVLPTANVASVWSGKVLNNNLSAVRSHFIAPVGTKVCNDGAYEGTVCGAKIVKSHFDSCVVTSDGKMCHLYMAHKPAGEVLIGQGDSGGPDYVVLRTSGGLVTRVKGIGLNSLETVANLNCPFFKWRGPVCSNTMLFTGLNAILKSYSATLRTRR